MTIEQAITSCDEIKDLLIKMNKTQKDLTEIRDNVQVMLDYKYSNPIVDSEVKRILNMIVKDVQSRIQ